MNSRIHQLLNQVVGEQPLPDLIDRCPHLLGFDLEGNPRMVAAGQVVALRAGLATLALFRTRQLLELPVELLHLPPVVVLDLSDKQVYSVVKVIGDDPVNVAVWGDYPPGGPVEQLYHKWAFLQLDNQPLDQRMLVKQELAQVLISGLFAQAHQAVALQRPPLISLKFIDIVAGPPGGKKYNFGIVV